MAIVVVLSVFNGFEDLSDRQLSRINPDITIQPKTGKVIADADSVAAVALSTDGVAAATPVITERAMLINDQVQLPVVFKAVDKAYNDVVSIDSLIIDGFYDESVDTMAAMQISIGVANRTGLRPIYGNMTDLYVPRRTGRINPANPAAAFRSEPMVVTAVIESDNAEDDNERVIIPLSVARKLLDYDREATSVDIALDATADGDNVMTSLQTALGENYSVLNRKMQQEEAFRMIEIEKWVTFMMLIFILAIASFNIISTLSLLVAEKRKDISTLRSLGASRRLVGKIFITQGFLITVIGGFAGIVAGVVLALVQQHFGLIKLAGDAQALTITVYPVVVKLTDILIVFFTILAVAIIISQFTRLFLRNIK